MGALWLFFAKTRLGRYLSLAFLVALLLAGVYWYGHRAGETKGRVDGGKQTMDVLGEQMKQDRTQFAAALQSVSSVIAQQNVLIARQDQQIAARDQKIKGLQEQRKATADDIAKMTDADAFRDLTRRLGIRDPQDFSSSLSVTEIRKADTVVADYDIQGRTLVEVSAKVDDMQVKIGALEQKAALTEHKFDLAMDYIDRADARMKDAYNIFYSIHHEPLWKKVLSFGVVKDKRIKELRLIVPPDKPKELAK